jgi:transposase InsO family protein
MVSPLTRRRAVREAVEAGMCGTAPACRALGLARSSFYRACPAPAEKQMMCERVLELSRQHPRYGYRRITALLHRAGEKVNAKRVQRIRRPQGLQVRKRQHRMRRMGLSTAGRRKADATNKVWSWDFVEDQTENGTRFRILTLIDEHTRECLALHAAWSIRAVDVVGVVEAAMARYGTPQHLRSDNGPEFIAYAIRDWLAGRGVKTMYITPGSPWENAYIESFHDKLRDELLNRELFGSLQEARIILGQWQREYNDERPHSSLGYKSPSEFAGRPHRVTPVGLRPPCVTRCVSGSERNNKARAEL